MKRCRSSITFTVDRLVYRTRCLYDEHSPMQRHEGRGVDAFAPRMEWVSGHLEMLVDDEALFAWWEGIIGEPGDWLVLKEVATVLGVAPRTLRIAIREETPLARRIGAVKPGRDWLVHRRNVEDELERRSAP